jgi:hypothetical protein
MAGTTIKFDKEGLPIPAATKKDTTVFDDEGLPIPKKKDAVGSPAPSDSSPKPSQTGQPVGTSVSDPKQVTANYKNGSLTPKDLGKPMNMSLSLPIDQMAGLVNNKTKNIEKWQNAPTIVNILKYTKGLQDTKKEQDQLANRQAYVGDVADYDSQMDALKGKENFFRSGIQKSYEAQKKKIVPELMEDLRNQLGGYKWEEIYSNETKDADGHKDVISPDPHLKYDPKTNKLTPESVKWVEDQVDASMNKRKDDVVNSAVTGDLDNKPRTYEDLSKDIVDQLNLLPIKKVQQDFADDYSKKNPEMAKALQANKDIHDYFSATNFDDVKARVRIETDKQLLNTKQRYYGDGGLFQQNQDFIGIQHRYAELVGEGKMSDKVARTQMQAEIEQNPALKKLRQNFEDERRKIIENASKQYEKYVIGGLTKSHPQYEAYKDGTIGLASMSEDQYTNMMEGYQEGMDSVSKKILGDQADAIAKANNDRAKEYGPLLGGLVSTTNELASGLTKMIFNKTGWGGDRVRNFQADEIAAPNIDQSDVAATWNWKGWESTLNPNWYLSGIGKMMPMIAGGVVVGALTEGEGIPEYMEWLGNGGLWTAMSSLSTYDNLLNSKDENGNMLSEADAAHFAANQAREDFLPNTIMASIGSGGLLRAKNIIKPTILGTLGRSAADVALQQPLFAMTGYNEYATMKEARGEKTDIYDYLQSKDFRDNLLNGLIMGGAFSAIHIPGNYMKSMDGWAKMVHMSEGEFKNMIPENYALGQEFSGKGDFHRDALKLKIFNTDPATLDENGKRELADTKNALLYSTNLDRNIRQGNLDPTKITDLYQAHNLALADQHDYLSDQAAKEGNKSLSDIYKDKEKDYREQAKAASNGEAKFTYLVNGEGHPIFMSDGSFKTLEQEGTISKWMKDGTVKDVVKSDDPEFSNRYKDFVTAKDESTVEGGDVIEHAKGLIEENKNGLGVHYEGAKKDPMGFLKDVADQALGRNADGSMSEIPNAEAGARNTYGNDIVDLAKVLYPKKEGGSNAVQEQTTGEGVLRQQGVRGEGGLQTVEQGDEGQKEPSGEEKEVAPTGAISETAPLPQQYKPQIRDDYFARSDFFTPEEKEKFQTLDDAGKDKMIDDKRAELKEQPKISVIQPGELKPPNIISSPKTTDNAEKTKEAEGREGDVLTSDEEGPGKQTSIKEKEPVPPSPPPPVVGPTEGGLHPHNEEWTSIQKKDLSERVQKENAFTQTNRETVDKVVARLAQDAAKNGRTWQAQAEFETSALHNEFFNEDGTIRQAFNPTTEQLALIGIRLMDINNEASIPDFNVNDDQQTARTAYLENEKAKAERLLSFGEAGRAFQFRQSLLKMGINGDIQIKRKAISASVGIKIPENEEQFRQLSKSDQEKIKPIYDAFQKWKEEYEKENKARNTVDETYSKAEFDKQLKEAVAAALKEAKVPDKGAKITKDSSKKIADSLKSFADKFEKFGRADLPEGTQKAGFGPDIQKKIADAIRWVAEKIANGDIKIPELISEAIERFKDKDLSESDLSENIKNGLKEAGIDEKTLNAKTNRENILAKMKQMAKDSDSKIITQKMVNTGMVRDYLHDIAKRGETDPEKILAKGVDELSKAFPGLDSKTLRDAYLKEGRFTPDKSKDLEDQVKAATQTFRDVTVLQRDIEALEAGAKLYGADKETQKTIISDYEQNLKDQKEKIIKDKAAAIRRNKDEYRKLETERNRQLQKVSELNEKLRKLQSGQRPEGNKSAPKEDTPEIESLKNQVKQADKDLREAEAAIKAAQKKAEKLAEYDKRISDLDNHQKVWERAKKGKEIDKDLAAKREELRKTLIKNGVKLETGSKESRAAKEKVIEAHNERVGHLKDKISDLLNDDTVSDEDKKALRSVQSELNKMDVKIDAGELDEKIKKAQSAASRLHTTNITNLLTGVKAEILSDLKNLSTQLKKDNNSALQDIQLGQVKSREIARKEQAERKLAAGEFEDVPKLSDYKKDEELMKLTRDRKKSEHDLAYQIDKYHKQNEGFWKRQVTRLQRLQRANLISGIMTNGKVLVATVVKPVSDALVRRTVGTLTTPAFKWLGLKGEREVLNNDATIRSFEDSFKGMTQRQAAERRGTTTKALETATTNLQAANDQLNTLKGTPEYQGYKDNEYTKAVNDYQSAQYEWAAAALYDFIAPNAWAERLKILQSGVSTFEESMGGYKGTTWADEKSKHAIGTGVNRIIHALEIFGRAHGAEKDISARQAFVEGFLKRASTHIKEGEQLTASKLEGIALQSYNDFLGGKFQNKNPVAEAIRGAEAKASEGGFLGKAFAFWLQSVTPVLKVPLNIEAEGLFKYTAGLPVAIGKTFYEIGKALKVNDLTIKDGIKDFNGTMDAIREHMKSLPAEKRDSIIQYANKGAVGLALALVAGSMAANGNLVFGGAYKEGQKKRKFLNADTGELEELNYGEMAINGHKVGKFWSAVIMHLPPLMPAVMGATYVQKYKDERGDYKDEADKTTAAFDGLSEVVRTAWEESALKSLGDIGKSPTNIFNSFTTQMAGKNISEYFDTDADGNLVERKGENTWQNILLRVGGRGFVPTKEQYEEDRASKIDESQQKVDERRENDHYYQKNQK